MSKKKTIPLMLIEMDVEAFNILYEAMMQVEYGSYAACAKAMQVSRLTWKHWETLPPNKWYLPEAMYRLLATHRRNLRTERLSKKRKKTRAIVTDAFDKLPREFRDTMEYGIVTEGFADFEHGAAKHILKVILRSDTGEVKSSDIVNAGAGYSKQAIQRAAKRLGVIISYKGYGKDKESYWRLPEEWED